MAVQTNVLTSYEQELIRIIHHALPVERIAQVVDFARYVETQAREDFISLDDEHEEDILAGEARWDAQFAASQEGLQRMADRVRQEVRAGRTKGPPKPTVCGESIRLRRAYDLSESVTLSRFIRYESDVDIAH